jgi:hypothetical protein
MRQGLTSRRAAHRAGGDVYHLVLPVDAPQYVERFGSGIGEVGVDAAEVRATVSRRSLELDLLVTQYEDLLVSERAARALTGAGLTGVLCDRRVALFVAGRPAPARFRVLLARGFAGLAPSSSGVRVTRFARDQVTFALPGDPRWGNDAVAVRRAGDAVRLWPFHDELFVSARFVEVVSAHRLTGFGFMPFAAREPRAGSPWRARVHRRLTLGPPPRWLSRAQKLSLWRQMRARAGTGVLPASPPAEWELGGARAVRAPALAPEPAALRWTRRALVPSPPRAVKREALRYLRDELASPDAAEWSLRDLTWDGDARDGRAVLRRWRLCVAPSSVWVIYDRRRDSFCLGEVEPVGHRASPGRRDGRV